MSERPLSIAVDAHPYLRPVGFCARWSKPLLELSSPEWLIAALLPSAQVFADDSRFAVLGGSDEATRDAIRKLLRYGGYKPSGRGKPASEYLLGAANEGTLQSINLAVDLCNAVSLHSGIPISVVDLDRVTPPLRIGIATAATSYVFNAAGQSIGLNGLLCLHDAEGPLANAVKDAQRTKTQASTRRVLCLVWGANALETRTQTVAQLYRELSIAAGAICDDVVFG